jgi:ABC-type uncharacterized transport system substrate-binding protein
LKQLAFIALLSAALAWPLSASAQDPAVPVIGFLNSASPDPGSQLLDAFRLGLRDGGYVEGRNIAIEYRWADGQFHRLPELAADLVRRGVALIAATGGSVSAQAAKTVTSTLPILFIAGFDPIADGLVTSLSRPGGNLTGTSVYTSELMPKRLQLLGEMVPHAATIALLVNPTGTVADTETKYLKATAAESGRHLVVINASADGDFETAFASAVQQRAHGLIVSANPFFTNRRDRIVALAARHAIPTAYPWRQYAEAGGLMSYGPSIAAAYRQTGRYASRILNGDRPMDLPVHLPTKYELLINAKAAKSLGLSVPISLFVAADELIQ